MVAEPEAFATAARDYVCVRVTDMTEIDLNVIQFDFDLTFAVLVMNADGTVYHRYGGRDADNPLSWMSMPSLVRLMRDTLADHAEYNANPEPPAENEPRPVASIPPLATKLAQRDKPDCVHCHTVHDALHAWAVQRREWTPDDMWIYPSPARIGLHLDPTDQSRITGVAPGSSAAVAGLRSGDHIIRLGVQSRVRTIGDVQWALHNAPFGDSEVPITYRRGDERRDGALRLASGWKRTTPEQYAWRPYKWNLSPAPGFGGPELSAAEKKRLSIEPSSFAFRVGYLVTWGEKAHRGRAAHRAGIRKGDVVVSFAGKDDFRSMDHFHAWTRMTLRAGEKVEVVLLRGRDRRSVTVTMPK